MDSSSQQAVQILEALASAYHRLRSFGYQVYLKNSLKMWDSSSLFSGSPSRFHHNDSPPETFSRCLPIGVHVTPQDGRSVIWGLHLLWTPTRWTVSADIELETDDESIRILGFPDRSSQTIGDCIAHIQEATSDLITSEKVLSDPRIAGNLGPAT